MNPNEQVEKEAQEYAIGLKCIATQFEEYAQRDYLAGHASGKKAGRQEAIDEMAGKADEGFKEVWGKYTGEDGREPDFVEPEQLFNEARTPLLARIKQLEMDARENDDWREHGETKLKNKIKALEGELLKLFKEHIDAADAYDSGVYLDACCTFPLAAELVKQERS